jgi:HPt (histidine-containing phosphotransfer) domain-containing protein
MREVLITTFAQDCHSALSALMQANAAGDVQSLRKIAHRLKGLFAQFGAPHAADYAAHLSDGETSEGVTAAFFDYAEAAVQAVVKALQEPQD